MENDFRTLFTTVEKIEPKKGLSSAVLSRIYKYRQRVARIKFAILSLISVASGTALFPVVSYALSSLTETGSYEYLSLLFSDGVAILPYWKEFAFTIIETIPVFEISMVLAVTYALLQSLKLAVKNAPAAFYRYN
jgi:hypothetical protein